MTWGDEEYWQYANGDPVEYRRSEMRQHTRYGVKGTIRVPTPDHVIHAPELLTAALDMFRTVPALRPETAW